MSWGGLAVVVIIVLILLMAAAYIIICLSIIIFILARNKTRAQPDPHKTNHDKVKLDLLRSQAGMEEYERQVVLDLLRDQLKYSQEDYSELQGEMKALRVQVAKVENGVGGINNRLDNYRILLSQLLEAKK